jgi:hypothetical protein
MIASGETAVAADLGKIYVVPFGVLTILNNTHVL